MCRIVGAGDFDPADLDPDGFSPSDSLLAADGGYDHLERLVIRPDKVLGDLDSIGRVPDGVPVQRFDTEKDETDLFLALGEGLDRGFSYFTIHGGTGGRLSHTLANLALLAWVAERGGQAFLRYRDTLATAVHAGRIDYDATATGLLSVLAFGGPATGIDLAGLKYDLSNGELNPAFPLGISNEFTGRAASVSVAKGTLLLVRES
jgi:thiamine pyrophosphokinase